MSNDDGEDDDNDDNEEFDMETEFQKNIAADATGINPHFRNQVTLMVTAFEQYSISYTQIRKTTKMRIMMIMMNMKLMMILLLMMGETVLRAWGLWPHAL